MRSIYLDYAATTPCDPCVVEAMRPVLLTQGNASSAHHSGRNTRKAVEEAREALASFIGASSTEIIFTSGATESNNQAIFTTAQALSAKGRHIVASAIEHHSILEPLGRLEQDGFTVTYLQPQPDGMVAVEDIRAALRPDTVLVCLHHANNEIGVLQPVTETGQLCRQRGICFLVDATQTIGHVAVDVKAMHCDFLSLSAHKFYGPQGIGALYARQRRELPSLLWGGDQERGRRAGTHNAPGIVGLGEAIKVCSDQMIAAADRETALRNIIIDTVLKGIPGAVLNGHQHNRLPNNAHFCFENIDGEHLVSALDMAGICVSMGSACTWGQLQPSHVLKAIGRLDHLALGSLRVTVGRWTTGEDVDYFLEQLKIKINALGK